MRFIKRSMFLLLFICLFFQNCAQKTLTTEVVTENAQPVTAARRGEVLFLGNTGKHHDSGKYAPWLAIELFKSGINLTYTTSLSDLNIENLSKYDGLIIYANHDSISADQEGALKAFVESGKGLIPLHSASGCFKNSDWYIKTIGGQLASHGTGSFSSNLINTAHPIMKGISEFTTTDETYLHKALNTDIVVLTKRGEEPYTWVREQGKGKVFYTAYGHDDATWKNAGFLKLVRNGVVWAIGTDVQNQIANLKIPNVDIYPDTIADFTARHVVPKIQPGLSPEESMKLIQVPVDFEVKLFAAEPDITNPISMAWDEKGRLWIVESVDYPNTFIETDGAANDRIKICEDTDGDGKADKFTVFADSLNIPTSIVFANGGVIISQAPNMVFLKDTDGDDKADVREKLITGWGTFDTHAGPSSLKYGLDNKIWGTVGYSGFNGKVNDQQMKFGQGLYRFAPSGKDMEYLGGTSNNTWGVGFSENNDVFISTANNTHSAFLGIPFSYLSKIGKPVDQSIEKIDGHYAMHVVTKNLRQVDVHNGFTAAAGHNLYTARNFPKKYWNRIAFVNEPTGRVVHEAVLEPKGSGFKERDGWNFVASADEWFGPVQSEVGPDGAVWVLDWYNFIIQHNPTPVGFENGKGNAYINPLRDRTHGRVYKVVYKNAVASKIKSLDRKDSKSLLLGLESDNMFWRTTAQRLIVETGNKTVVPALYKLIRDRKVDELGINASAIHALWTLQGLGLFDGSNAEAFGVAVEALKHPSAGVRKAAIQVLPNNSASLAAILKADLIKDTNLNTRLAAVLKVSELPVSPTLVSQLQAGENLAENKEDKWLGTAFTVALKRHMPISVGEAGTDKKVVSAVSAKTVGKVDKVITIKPIINAMKYDLKTFTVKAGSTVEVVFKNVDFMQHNLLILQKGSMDKVGAAADKLAQDPKGASLQYVPKMPEVLFHTSLVNPEGSETLRFKVPATAGNYPYICSFPGHWRIMNGVMKVVP